MNVNVMACKLFLHGDLLYYEFRRWRLYTVGLADPDPGRKAKQKLH